MGVGICQSFWPLPLKRVFIVGQLNLNKDFKNFPIHLKHLPLPHFILLQEWEDSLPKAGYLVVLPLYPSNSFFSQVSATPDSDYSMICPGDTWIKEKGIILHG